MDSILIIIVILIIFFLFNIIKKKTFRNSNKILTLYYTNWCNHCRLFKPIWNKLKTKLDITFNEIDCSNIDDPPVSGFPTIILTYNSKNITFDGERNIKNIIDFVDNNN